jgi:hypothetical protein
LLRCLRLPLPFKSFNLFSHLTFSRNFRKVGSALMCRIQRIHEVPVK